MSLALSLSVIHYLSIYLFIYLFIPLSHIISLSLFFYFSFSLFFFSRSCCSSLVPFISFYSSQSLPLNAEPEVFGMHDNANITCAITVTDSTFEVILALQVLTRTYNLIKRLSFNMNCYSLLPLSLLQFLPVCLIEKY